MFKSKSFFFSFVLLVATGPLWPQASSKVSASKTAEFPTKWPVGPQKSSVLDWARLGRIRFAR